jgi:UTP--glucose-1-phosphate uridylyltransferase
MREADPGRMEKHPSKSRTGGGPVQCVTDDRMSGGRQVRPDLVGAPGVNADLQQAVAGPGLQHAEVGHRRPALPRPSRHPRPAHPVPPDRHFEPRPPDTFDPYGPASPFWYTAMHQREIGLVYPSLGELPGELPVSGIVLRDHQHAAGQAVQPVNDAGTQQARRLRQSSKVIQQSVHERAARHPGAGVDGHAGRLVNHREILVLVEDLKRDLFRESTGQGRLRLCGLGCHLDLLAASQPQRRFGHRFSDAHPALLDPLLQPGAAGFGQLAREELIEPQPGVVRRGVESHQCYDKRFFRRDQVIKSAIVPVAGLGTRLLPATKSQPKEMLPVAKKPIVQYVVEELVAAGIERILFVTGRGKSSIENHFDHDPELSRSLSQNDKNGLLNALEFEQLQVHYLYTRQRFQKGLGDAILCGENLAGEESFLVALGDSIIGLNGHSTISRRIAEVYENERASCVIAVEEVPRAMTSFYGVVAPESDGDVFRIKDLVEKPSPDAAPSNLAIAGRYVFSPIIFDMIRKVSADRRGEIQLTDAIRLLADRGKRIIGVKLAPGERRYDIGNFRSYFETFIEFALADPEHGESLRQSLKRLCV